jgi:Domain of unknown function (DUF3458_C) ARM repeats
LLGFDSDPFNRWEAGQRLALTLLLQGIANYQLGQQVNFPDFLPMLSVAFWRTDRRIRPSRPKLSRCRSKSTSPSNSR